MRAQGSPHAACPLSAAPTRHSDSLCSCPSQHSHRQSPTLVALAACARHGQSGHHRPACGPPHSHEGAQCRHLQYDCYRPITDAPPADQTQWFRPKTATKANTLRPVMPAEVSALLPVGSTLPSIANREALQHTSAASLVRQDTPSSHSTKPPLPPTGATSTRLRSSLTAIGSFSSKAYKTSLPSTNGRSIRSTRPRSWP